MPNKNSALGVAKNAKKDEFYTQLSDIEKELHHYRQHFKGKTVLCNCDDPFESNFFKYFVLNFNQLGLKKLIATSYVSSPIAGSQFNYYFDDNGQMEFTFGGEGVQMGQGKRPYKAVVTSVHDATGNGGIEMEDIAELFKTGENTLDVLNDNGDFRSEECIEALEEADIVCTNPPFSLFQEYVSMLEKYNKKFLIIGNVNAITYKEFFPLLMNDKVWLGVTMDGRNHYFRVPDSYPLTEKTGKIENGIKYAFVKGPLWYTNLDIKKRHEELILVKKYDPEKYQKYDNYDAINVDKVVDIPEDYDGIMGVPISFLNKYNPDQFEILGITKTWFGLASKTYPKQIQVNKEGREQIVTKLNDGPVLKLNSKPSGMTYYVVDDNYYIQLYARILIRKRS